MDSTIISDSPQWQTLYVCTFAKMAFNMNISGPKMVMHDKTLAEMFMIQLENNNGLFGIDCSTGKEYSYPKLKNDVLAMATALQMKNFGIGDIVMASDYGSYEGNVVLLAGLLIGATIAALDYNLKKETLAALINESKPDVLFCTASGVNIISDVLNTIAHQPLMKISTINCEDFISYSNMISTNDLFVLQPTKSVNTNRPCAIIFSSGTTGIPKGIYLSDDALKSAAISLKRTLMEEPIENRFMSTTPLFWYTGVLLLMLGINFGKPRLFFSAKPTAEQILCSIEQLKPTFLMTGVAAVNEMMICQMENGHKYNIQSLITLVTGGSPMRDNHQKIITKNLLRDRIPIKQAYGATEQGLITIWSMKSDINTVIDGSVGRPAPGIKIKIVSLETGECLGSNMEGEILTKSVSNMMGYAYDMKKNILSYNEDGWFKTGDVGYYTNDGCLFIVGRIKELMIYQDNRIAPTDIETVLLSHPAVFDAGVTSRESLLGDLLIGVIKLKPGQNVEPHEIISFVKDKVCDHEQLRGGVIFVDDVPRSPAGKLKREELKSLIK